MKHPYSDITDEITALLRTNHELQDASTVIGYYPDNCTAFRGPLNEPQTERCQCVAKPRWWDEHGVPRFAFHSPLLCPNIGASEVALLLISCQSCAREFSVQMSWSHLSALKNAYPQRPAMNDDAFEKLVLSSSLAYQIAGRGPHYGDPPFHRECLAGSTMNVWDLRVLEFWRRLDGTITYVRIPELEIALPDLTDTDRVGPS